MLLLAREMQRRPLYPLLFPANVNDWEREYEASASSFSCDPFLSRTHACACGGAFIDEAHAPHPSGVTPRISRLSYAVLRQWHAAPATSRKRSDDHQNRSTRDGKKFYDDIKLDIKEGFSNKLFW